MGTAQLAGYIRNLSADIEPCRKMMTLIPMRFPGKR
jgi:hypothetical protein